MISNVQYLVGVAGLWCLANGILHDIFVLLQRKPFDRELIRLLLDGHILIFSGVFYLLCYKGIGKQETVAFSIGVGVAFFQIGYCLLIFKILPSYLTLLINLAVLLALGLTFP